MIHDVAWETARLLAYELGTLVRERIPHEELVPLSRASGRTLARDVTALQGIPHYASSAMDGWAVAGSGPWRIQPRAAQDEPHAASDTLGDHQARVILTGGALPHGCTAVVRSEAASEYDGVLSAPEPRWGADIRPAEREAKAGDVLLAAGTVLTPPRLAVIAASGWDDVHVVISPPVGLVLSGREVVTSGVPLPGQVRDSFSEFLPPVLTAWGAAEATPFVQRIGDDLASTLRAIETTDAQIILSTGGTGHSDHDFLRKAAEDLGARILVPSVAMRPGHPAFLAQLPDDRVIVGLPGNPLAAFMAALTILQPLLDGVLARSFTEPRQIRVGERFTALPGRVRLVPAGLSTDDTAGNSHHELRVISREHTGPAMLRGLGDADGVMVIPPEGTEPGDSVRWLELPW
ncbi:molybdopterin molybdotransferase [Neomicrococcus aestuarii]|uniref:Molybdopterin molybdenumtransferase n=1 Tax=Neomicrococcus aestuarii TaxID=556325 RepID=A0A7W8TSU9_9MICC|nr:molybdopterin molybdotransferase MoeA [Neomicrococcus aestuarii]MBB5512307.1 molybdopterin molybdotransferase [Neomicrococcus aestuarii]